MADSPPSRPAGGVEDRELVERVAQAISAVDGIDWDRTSGAVRNIERERAEAALHEAGSAGDADHLTARECKLVLSGFEKTRNMEELTNAEDMALVRLDRLAGEAD